MVGIKKPVSESDLIKLKALLRKPRLSPRDEDVVR